MAVLTAGICGGGGRAGRDGLGAGGLVRAGGRLGSWNEAASSATAGTVRAKLLKFVECSRVAEGRWSRYSVTIAEVSQFLV